MTRPRTFGDDARQKIILAAAHRLDQGGPDNIPLRTLAAENGCSTTVLYAMFGDKQGLIAAIMQTALASFAESQHSVPTTDDPLTDLVQLSLEYRRWALGHSELYRIMMGASSRLSRESYFERGTPQYEHAIEPLSRMTARARDAGLLVPAPLDALTGSIWANIHGLVTLELGPLIDVPETDRNALALAHVTAHLAGWAPPPGAPPQP